jgi:hypothetical protein
MKRPRVGPLNLIVHCPQSTAGRTLLIIVADDCLLPALGLGPDALLEELLATVSCPEISDNESKEWVCGEPISMAVSNTYTSTAERWARSSSSPCTAESC